jgi:hypothetical protein
MNVPDASRAKREHLFGGPDRDHVRVPRCRTEEYRRGPLLRRRTGE